MAEIFRHTDEDGAYIEVHSREAGDLQVYVGADVGIGVDVPEIDGRRLLAALLRYYGSKDSIEEEARHG